MGINYSPKIVTDGLVLCLDAANPLSYPGSGNTWYDLSGNGNNGTLSGGLDSSDWSNGAFTFSGNEWVQRDGFSVTPQNNELSICLWYLASSNVNEKMVIDLCNTSNTSTNRDRFSIRHNWQSNSRTSFYFKNDSGTFYYTNLINQIAINTWTHIAYTKISNTIYGYLNGELINSKNVSGNIAEINRLLIGQDNLLGSNKLVGKVSAVSVYDHGLYGNEIVQNYKATKGRFGL
jgi:hypothetical protein